MKQQKDYNLAHYQSMTTAQAVLSKEKPKAPQIYEVEQSVEQVNTEQIEQLRALKERFKNRTE